MESDKQVTPVEPVRELSPDHIMQVGLGFWSSKTLLSAIELGVFTELADGPLPASSLAQRTGVHSRSALDFFDSLVALGFLSRREQSYSNTDEAARFLVRGKPGYIGGMLEMANSRLYGFWGSLTDALRTGSPQNEIVSGGDFFGTLYADPKRLEEFLSAMTGLSMRAAIAIAEKFPWGRYETFFDVGAAQGALPVQLARAHPHLSGGGFDLAPVRPIFERYVESHGLGDRLEFREGDFFTDPLPEADVLVMGHILHDWNLEQKKELIAKAYDAIHPDGALIIYEALIDDDRSKNAFGLLMSLNMLIETEGGFDYPGADCERWLREAGFRETRVEHLVGPDAMVVGIK